MIKNKANNVNFYKNEIYNLQFDKFKKVKFKILEKIIGNRRKKTNKTNNQ